MIIIIIISAALASDHLGLAPRPEVSRFDIYICICISKQETSGRGVRNYSSIKNTIVNIYVYIDGYLKVSQEIV